MRGKQSDKVGCDPRTYYIFGIRQGAGSKKVSKEGKHHYIPVFYLKQWRAADGRLCVFSKPHKEVIDRRLHPDGTGYVHGLYTISGLPPSVAQYLETSFFQIADDSAARALRIILGGGPWKFTDDERSGWARFLVSLIIRNPESIERHKISAKNLYEQELPKIKSDYLRNRNSDDPPTYEEYIATRSDNPAGRSAAILIQRVIDSPLIGNWIVGMRWMVLVDRQPPFLLLTSDRPIVMTNGINKPNSQIILPISPYHLFVATNNEETESYIKSVMYRKQMIQQINDRVAQQSHKFVFGYDNSQLNFVAKRLGTKLIADPVQTFSFQLPKS